jgi:hypothetical protein
VIDELGSYTMATTIGPIFPVTVSPVSLTKSEMVVSIDTSEQALTGSLSVSVFSQAQGQVQLQFYFRVTKQTDVTINAYQGTQILSLPLSKYPVVTGVPIPLDAEVQDASGQTVGKNSTGKCVN